MNIEPLQKLIDLCDQSDDAQYGTLGIPIVRQLVAEAMVEDAVGVAMEKPVLHYCAGVQPK